MSHCVPILRVIIINTAKLRGKTFAESKLNYRKACIV